MFEIRPEERVAADQMLQWALGRLGDRRQTLPPLSPEPALPELTRKGVGVEHALRQLRDAVFPTALPVDHPRYLAFIPGAPSVGAVVADMALSAAGIYGGTRLEAGTAAAAEDAVLQWLAEAAGLPSSAGGTFVSGGSISSLSALVAARGAKDGEVRPHLVIVGASGHPSLAASADIMGCDVVVAEPADDYGRLDGETLREVLSDLDPTEVVAVAATAGATNNGAVDDLVGVAHVCQERSLWLHVDAAYGGGGLLSARTRPLFAGIERADSLTIDPHKWLFAPYDCAAVIYREPAVARRALTQHAAYMDAVDDEAVLNPSDLAIHLTRRARGVPLWASVLAYGTDAFVRAVDSCLDLTEAAAAKIDSSPYLELAVEPALSVVLFHRLGWMQADYDSWSNDAIRSGLAVALPTRHLGQPALRFCFVNPLTTLDDIDMVLASLA